MKNLMYIFLCLLLVFTSCIDDVLDRKPLDIVSDGVVWEDPALIDAYLTNVYLMMPILTNETPNISGGSQRLDWNGPFIINELSDESKRGWIAGQANTKMTGMRINTNILAWWESAYEVIRMLNEFIERLPDAPVDESYRKQKIAEARFLRAYNYFSMVKRYGGVPIITTAQDINTPDEELYPARDKEQDVYDFVLSEMDAIVNDLPDRTVTEYGRPSKYAALALKSRAAVYAGSIAQFGTLKLNGIVGIDASKADDYYQQAYNASKEIMNSGSFALYNQDADKVTNFKNVFLQENNSEVIWAKLHDNVQRELGGNGWVWDFFQCPKPQAWNAGCQDAVYLEMAESFEMLDGSPGTLDREAIEQGLWTMEEIWGNRDPRFYATIYTQDTPWKDGKVTWYYGLILPDGTIQTKGSYNGVLATGTQGRGQRTGFGVMKYLVESKDNMGQRSTSETDWILFRYAEILLNFAEASFELGKTDEAMDAINQIRERAGVALLSSVNRERIQHERKVELAFEGHRYWDLRRWRLAVDVLTVNRSGLNLLLDYTTGKFKIEVEYNKDSKNSDPLFYEENYYFPITLNRTANNPNLVENPGYQ